MDLLAKKKKKTPVGSYWFMLVSILFDVILVNMATSVTSTFPLFSLLRCLCYPVLRARAEKEKDARKVLRESALYTCFIMHYYHRSYRSVDKS